MMAQLGMPLVPELALFALAVLVLISGLIRPGRAIGWITFVPSRESTIPASPGSSASPARIVLGADKAGGG